MTSVFHNQTIHDLQQDRYVIWSFKHNAWWGPNEAGYTQNFKQAGLYTAEQAAACVRRNIFGQTLAIHVNLLPDNSDEPAKLIMHDRTLIRPAMNLPASMPPANELEAVVVPARSDLYTRILAKGAAIRNEDALLGEFLADYDNDLEDAIEAAERRMNTTGFSPQTRQTWRAVFDTLLARRPQQA